MLEGKDYAEPDNICPFLGGIVSRCYGGVGDDLISTVFS